MMPAPRSGSGVWRPLALAAAFLSPLFFPWPLVAIVALVAATLWPLAPLATGLFADVLYYAHGSSSLVPWATILGAVATTAAFFVRRFFETSIIGS